MKESFEQQPTTFWLGSVPSRSVFSQALGSGSLLGFHVEAKFAVSSCCCGPGKARTIERKLQRLLAACLGEGKGNPASQRKRAAVGGGGNDLPAARCSASSSASQPPAQLLVTAAKPAEVVTLQNWFMSGEQTAPVHLHSPWLRSWKCFCTRHSL